jgi:hypothetical protein
VALFGQIESSFLCAEDADYQSTYRSAGETIKPAKKKERASKRRCMVNKPQPMDGAVLQVALLLQILAP